MFNQVGQLVVPGDHENHRRHNLLLWITPALHISRVLDLYKVHDFFDDFVAGAFGHLELGYEQVDSACALLF